MYVNCWHQAPGPAFSGYFVARAHPRTCTIWGSPEDLANENVLRLLRWRSWGRATTTLQGQRASCRRPRREKHRSGRGSRDCWIAPQATTSNLGSRSLLLWECLLKPCKHDRVLERLLWRLGLVRHARAGDRVHAEAMARRLPWRPLRLGEGDRAAGLALTIQIVAKRKVTPAPAEHGIVAIRSHVTMRRDDESDRATRYPDVLIRNVDRFLVGEALKRLSDLPLRANECGARHTHIVRWHFHGAVCAHSHRSERERRPREPRDRHPGSTPRLRARADLAAT